MVNSALHASTNGDRRVPARPLLNRLVADRSGNVLAIAAACIPPMLILVGSGVDMSRAYMTQASLQSACDAGVLAGRRAQAKSGAWGASEQGKAQRMFTFNFQSTASAATNTSFVPTDAGAGVIRGVATTTIMFVEIYYQYQPIFFTIGGAAPTIYRAAAMYVRDDRDLSQIYNPAPSAPVNSC